MTLCSDCFVVTMPWRLCCSPSVGETEAVPRHHDWTADSRQDSQRTSVWHQQINERPSSTVLWKHRLGCCWGETDHGWWLCCRCLLWLYWLASADVLRCATVNLIINMVW